MLNRYVAVGRLVRDPELRRTGAGVPVVSFTLAVGRNVKVEGQPEADFIPCVAWNKLAENVAQWLYKGYMAGVEGRLQSRSYTDADNKKRTVYEVVCDNVQFMEQKATNDKYANKNMPSPSKQAMADISREVSESFSQQFNNQDYEIQDDDIQF